MWSRWIRWVLNPVAGVLERRERFGDTERHTDIQERRSCDNRGREWSVAVTIKEGQRWQAEAGRGEKGFFQKPPGEADSVDTLIWGF